MCGRSWLASSPFESNANFLVKSKQARIIGDQGLSWFGRPVFIWLIGRWVFQQGLRISPVILRGRDASGEERHPSLEIVSSSSSGGAGMDSGRIEDGFLPSFGGGRPIGEAGGHWSSPRSPQILPLHRSLQGVLSIPPLTYSLLLLVSRSISWNEPDYSSFPSLFYLLSIYFFDLVFILALKFGLFFMFLEYLILQCLPSMWLRFGPR